MTAFETKGTVGPDGCLTVEAPQELANQEVNVVILPKRPPAAERLAAWERLRRRLRDLPHIQRISEEDIQREIEAVRSGQ